MKTIFVYMLLTIISLTTHSKAQSPPPSIKKAIDKLLNPETGDEALRNSRISISKDLKNYVLAKLSEGIDLLKISKEFEVYYIFN